MLIIFSHITYTLYKYQYIESTQFKVFKIIKRERKKRFSSVLLKDSYYINAWHFERLGSIVISLLSQNPNGFQFQTSQCHTRRVPSEKNNRYFTLCCFWSDILKTRKCSIESVWVLLHMHNALLWNQLWIFMIPYRLGWPTELKIVFTIVQGYFLCIFDNPFAVFLSLPYHLAPGFQLPYKDFNRVGDLLAL